MTPSASARCRRSTMRSTSITSSWRSRRAIGRIRACSTRFTFRRPRQSDRCSADGIAAGDYASSTGPASTAATIAADSAKNLATNAIAVERPFGRFDGRCGHNLARDNGSALGLRQIRAGPHAAQRQPSGPVRGDDDFLQSGAGRSLSQAKTEIDNTIERSACRRPSVARSLEPRRPFSNRNRACRSCSAPRS